MRPQHSALLSTLTPQENRNPVLTDMYWPSGGANIASIMAFASGSVCSYRPRYPFRPSTRLFRPSAAHESGGLPR